VTGKSVALGPTPAEAGEAATGIAVVPFSVNGEQLGVWREGMVDVLSTNLDGLGGFRAIDSRTVLARWHAVASGAEDTDLEDALRVAGATGARYALVGSVVGFGDQVRLTAEIYDVADGTKMGQARREGSPSDVLRLSDGLAVDVIRALLGNQGAELVSESQVESLSTSSIEALRHYLEGEALIRRGEFERAASAFEAAVDQDSTFASAYYRLTQAYGWMEAGGDAAERAELALRALKENLPPRDRLILQGEEALSRGDAGGIPLMEDAVKRYPDDPDAWILLGEHYVHQGDRLNRTLDDTWEAFSRAAELDPTFSPTYIHYAETAMRRGDVEEARSLIDRYLTLSVGTHQGSALSLAFDLQFGDAAAHDAALAALDTLESHTARDLTSGLAFSPTGQDALQAVAGALWKRTRNAGWGATLFEAQVTRGRLSAARTTLAESGSEMRGLAPFLLRLADPENPEPSTGSQACAGDGLCLLLVGAAATDGRDAAGLAAAKAALDTELADARTKDQAGRVEWLSDSRDALTAYEAWRAGDADGALRTFARVERGSSGWGTEGAVLRLWMGQIDAEQGRTADADATFASLGQHTPLGWHGLLLQARLHRDAGDAEAAKGAYGRFLELWSDAPADHPYVVEARKAVG
jgi:tetratricopeptide (TPR) repeat protein